MKTLLKIAGATVLFGVICVLCASWAPAGEGNGRWYSIVPPLLAITMAFLTRHVLLSLGAAVFVGGILSVVPQASMDIHIWFKGVANAATYIAGTFGETGNLQLLAIFPAIFSMIAIIVASGGFLGVINWLLRWVKGRKSAQAMTAFVGVLCFIDDYTNTMIVGSMMRPVTDRFRVSREKLAFLVDATSAPISGLAVISTWIAYEVGLFSQVSAKLNLGIDGYSMFFDAVVYQYYCILMIVFVFVLIFVGRDFGPMKTAEERAQNEHPPEYDDTTGRDDNHHSAMKAIHSPTPRAINAIVPLTGLILFHFVGLWIDGGGLAKLRAGGSLSSWLYWRDVISSANNSTLVLLFASLFGLGLVIVCGRCSGGLSLPVIRRCFSEGLKKSLLISVILVMAWSLKNCCDDLGTDDFLGAFLVRGISPQWFPAIVFIVASLTSFATGTSWGTMAILIPTAVPVAYVLEGSSYGIITMITMGAVLDGAIFGDHCSPISDTTIISSLSSSCDLLQHVRTQLPYSLVVAAFALTCGYIPSSFGLGRGWNIALAVVIMGTFFIVLARRKRT